MRIASLFRLLPTLCLAALLPAAAAERAKPQHVEAELLSESTGIAPGKTFWAGLHLKLEPHWHVYWKNPGDAGLPVSLDWTLPKGFTASPIQWPHPERIDVPPLMNYGYEGEVLLPVEITAPANLPAGKSELKAKAKWVVCKDICLPGSAELSLSLPATETSALPPADPAHAALFTAARAALPLQTSAWKFSALAIDSTLTLIATPPPGATLASLSFFPDESDLLENAAPQAFYPIQGGYALDLKSITPEEGAKGPDSLTGVAVSESGWNAAKAKAVQVRVAIQRGKVKPVALSAPTFGAVKNGSAGSASDPGAAAIASVPAISPATLSGPVGGAAPQAGFTKLLLMLSLAFMGGLILNLMPCVLPVLSLKIFDFVKRAGESRWKIFSHGLIFTAGVLISFWILAGLLLILRSGGSELGWGFQLQSPGFLVVLCALFFFFSLNLFGVFELGYMFTRIGGTGTQSGWLGSFMAGVTATVVATPCTAPFMGSAMGYAFTQPPYYAMLVFTFLGLGMAAPYLVLSGFPGLMKFLPKPGEWMEHLKQFMGFPLLATAIWLAWVLGKQAGVDALIALLFVLLLAGLSAWILGKWTALHRTTPVRVVAALVALVVFIPAFVLVLVYMDQIRESKPKSIGMATAGAGGPAVPGELQWETFSEARVMDLVSQGKPVFVDFTADWCLSCKVNEKVAFSSSEVTQKFLALKMNLLKADWTLRDEAIAHALAKYGRNSIPLYVLYSGNGMDDFVMLPEVLSPGILLEALAKVEAGPKTTMNRVSSP
ncbi:MAG: Thiol:disulfide interchange protein [Fibrobacteres bacterium]|nr:Thiol:disulfide interchange protein [Fibrobacterota bacterium]